MSRHSMVFCNKLYGFEWWDSTTIGIEQINGPTMVNSVCIIQSCIILTSILLALSTPKYLNRFRSGFTLFPIMWTVKNDFDADPFYLDRKAVRWVVSIRV